MARAVQNEQLPMVTAVAVVTQSPISAESNDVGICRRCRREFRRSAGFISFTFPISVRIEPLFFVK